MLRKILLLIIFFAAFLFIFSPKISAAENLIQNGGFEELQEYWKTNSSNVSLDIISAPVKEGIKSAMITNSSNTSYGVEQIIQDIVPDQRYKITGFVHVGDPSATKAFIRVAWYSSLDGTGSQITTHDSPMLSDETDWQLLEFFPTSPSAAHSAKLRLLTSNGAAIFDDIHFEIYDEEPTFTPTPTLTPSLQPTLTPTPTSQTSSYNNIFISAIMAAPSPGNPEWVELYNNNDFEVDLVDWYIDDSANGGSSPKKISVNIPAKQFVAIDFTSAIFNNSGDSVRLLDPNENVKDSITYEEAQIDQSFGRNDLSNNDVCLQDPTKSTPNGNCIDIDETTADDTDDPETSPTVTPTTTRVPTKTPTKKIMHVSSSQKKLNKTASQIEKNQKDGKVLGKDVKLYEHKRKKSPLPHLTLLSMFYSVCSIVSLTLKIHFG